MTRATTLLTANRTCDQGYYTTYSKQNTWPVLLHCLQQTEQYNVYSAVISICNTVTVQYITSLAERLDWSWCVPTVCYKMNKLHLREMNRATVAVLPRAITRTVSSKCRGAVFDSSAWMMDRGTIETKAFGSVTKVITERLLRPSQKQSSSLQ